MQASATASPSTDSEGMQASAIASPSTDIVALGEAMIEFNEARASDAHAWLQGFGGDTSNMAIAAARLLGRTVTSPSSTRAITSGEAPAAWKSSRSR